MAWLVAKLVIQSMFTHYAPMMSYYSAKTRAYLSFKHIPFVENYDPEVFNGRIVSALGFTTFPVLEGEDGEIIQDTTVIIDELEQRYPERPVFPEDPVLMLVTRIVEFFIDELWVVTAMHTRWNDPDARRFATTDFNQQFGRGDPKDVWTNGDAVAEKMQGHLPGMGIDTAKGQRVIQRLFEEATQLLNLAVGPRRFAFGQRASLIDCCLHEGYFAHHYRDYGAAQRYIKSEAPALSYFIDNMQAAFSAPASGELALSDEFLSYLCYIGPIGAAYATSVMQQSQPLIEATAPGEVLKQSLSPEIELYGQPYKRNCGIFSAWKVQRVQDVYKQLSAADRQRAQALIEDIGWTVIIGYQVPRIERIGFGLRRASH
jgi:glutathione S-transferase